jgi:60 kDa SS-A/Ro ribonucleoprotein
MPDPLRKISTRVTPQSEQADSRQVPNSAGGYGFKVTGDARLHRFLTLGTEGGTYYATEQKITKNNAEVVLGWARQDARTLVSRLMDVSVQGRAPRNNAALFALAAAAGLGNDEGRKASFGALPYVARTGTHLYTWAGYSQQFRGWGRGMRRAVSDWYLAKDADKLAYQMVKYRQRDGWKHRDLLRLAHPVFNGTTRDATPEQRALFEFACGNRRAFFDSLPLLATAYLAALAIDRSTASTKAKAAAYVALIAEHPGLPWEALPDSALTQPDVWAELIRHGLPQTALMRQLPRLTTLGVLTQLGTLTDMVAAQLADPERLKRARVHPVAVLLAAKTYASGRSVRGDSSWQPVPKISDALDAAFYAAYGAVEPANKRTMVALDVSGSMGSLAGGLPLSCREASVALALVTLATESQVLVTGFTAGGGYGYQTRWGSGYDTSITPLNISSRQRLDDAVRTVSHLPFGGTDCALPMIWAQQNNVPVDTFLTVTDNETWAGNIHPHQALEAYRQKTGIGARLAVAAMTPTEFTIADPDDPGSMDVSGFDSAVPTLLADFSRGDV